MKAVATRPKSAAEDLSGKQKAAVVLMAMGPQAAAEITKIFTAAEIEEISYEIARMERVSSEVVNDVLAEWGQMEQAAVSIAEGGVDYARQVLESAVGAQKAATILKRIETQLRESAGFRNLRNADPSQMAALLRNEHPQTVALLLAHLEPEQTASMLKDFPPELGGDVLLRLARLDKVLPEVLQVLEKCYGSESTVTISKDLSVAGGPQAVANVLNQMTASLEKELIDIIATHDAPLSDDIKNLMFTFEDIVRLDDRSMQRVLRDVQMKELALALKAASEPLKTRIIGLMSSRAADTLREEMSFLGPVRLRDVESAQAAVVRNIRALEAAGEIVIGGGDDDMVL
jgi:flagellar motor switch protein FliG